MQDPRLHRFFRYHLPILLSSLLFAIPSSYEYHACPKTQMDRIFIQSSKYGSCYDAFYTYLQLDDQTVLQWSPVTGGTHR